MEVVMESPRRKGGELRQRYRHGESGGRRAGFVNRPGSDLLIEVGPQGQDRYCGGSSPFAWLLPTVSVSHGFGCGCCCC